ncbi:MAG TPA: patatin-like protein [Acidimicrobiia bacterium]|nr:patatin-like protein [Acidimicrobiia bacterium]
MATLPRDQELRLAVVMSGGVSLAIWMGGTTAEVDRLRREQGVYREVLALLGQDPMVDIVSGTSAGGLNGVLLASAVANGASADAIRNVWTKSGDFKQLLRPVSDNDPPSLLRGDDYFLPQLNEALEDLSVASAGGSAVPAGGAASISPGVKPPLHLFVTTSLVANRARRYIDSTGQPVSEVEHRGTMSFAEKHLRDPAKIAALALAARSSASFPIAFEPSWLPVKGMTSDASKTDVSHPDMTDHAWWVGSGYALDGGLVMNRPLRPAIQQVAQQPGVRSVRRVVVLVDPNPKTEFDDDHQTRDLPSLLGVGKSMGAITGTQSIADDFEELRAHNEQVARQRGLRDAISRIPPDDLAATARPFRDMYATQRGTLWARDLLTSLAEQRVLEAPRHLDDQGSLLERTLAHVHTAQIAAAVHEVFDPTLDVAAWHLDAAPLERAARDALALLRGMLKRNPWSGELQLTLQGLRDTLTAILTDLRKHSDAEAAFWSDELSALAPAARPGAIEQIAQRWASAPVGPQGSTPPEWLGAIATALAPVVQSSMDGVNDLALPASAPGAPGAPVVSQRPTDADFYAAAAAEVHSTVAFTSSDDAQVQIEFTADTGAPALPPLARRWVLVDVLHAPVLATAVPNDEALDLVHLSANAPNAFDGRHQPEAKLTGLQLHHFGAFYRASWRGNDWMWGRLDGAHHLMQALLFPERLFFLYFDGVVTDQLDAPMAELRRAIVSIATGLTLEQVDEVLAADTDRDGVAAALVAGDPDRHYLVQGIAARIERLDVELAALARGVDLSALDVTASWITRRIQLGILREELPQLAADVDTDLANGAEGRTSLRSFRAKAGELAGPPPAPAEKVVAAFTSCDIGAERLEGEMHSQLFAEVSSQTAAVALNAVSGTSGFTALRPILGGARGLTKALYHLTSAVREKNPVWVAVVGFVALLAAATLAVAVIGGTSLVNPVAAVALLVVAALMIAALLRDRTGVAVAATSALILLGWIAAIIWAGSLQGVLQVALALVGALVLLSLVYWSSENRSSRFAVVALVAWLVAIGLAVGVAVSEIGWRHVATPGDCTRALIVLAPDDGQTAAQRAKGGGTEVLCIEGDGNTVLVALAVATGIALVGVGLALCVVKFARWRRRERAQHAEPIYGTRGLAVAWLTKGLLRVAFVDDAGRVVAWVHDGRLYDARGFFRGSYRNGLVRDRQGRVVAFRAGAFSIARPLLPVAVRPQPRRRPSYPFRKAPLTVNEDTDPPEASPVSWTALVTGTPPIH